MHYNKKHGSIVLSEVQFDIVKKVYTKCFIDNKFSLINDPQMILQFFKNIKALKNKLQKQGIDK